MGWTVFFLVGILKQTTTIYKFASYCLLTPWFTQLWRHTWLPDFVELVLEWFDCNIFRFKNMPTNIFQNIFFMNQDAKLYVIMLFIL